MRCMATQAGGDQMPARTIISRKEVARRLGVSDRTVDRLLETPATGLRKVQLSVRRVGVAEDELNAFIERVTTQAAA
jgi:predicted DNA-binding transcriptional regulator AlpA